MLVVEYLRLKSWTPNLQRQPRADKGSRGSLAYVVNNITDIEQDDMIFTRSIFTTSLLEYEMIASNSHEMIDGPVSCEFAMLRSITQVVSLEIVPATNSRNNYYEFVHNEIHCT